MVRIRLTHSAVWYALLLLAALLGSAGCKTSYGMRHAIAQPDAASLWAAWIKDEGDTFDIRVVLKNLSTTKALVARRTDIRCWKGTTLGQVRVLKKSTELMRLDPGERLELTILCELDRETPGAFKLAFLNLRDGTTGKPLLSSLAWPSVASARQVVVATAPAPRPVISEPSQQPAAAAPKPPARTTSVVAVFDIQDRGTELDTAMLSRLTEYLATQLTATGRFQVIPPAQLRKRLVEQKKSSYQKCFDQSCQIEIGRELAAEKSLSSSVMRLGSSCAVNAVLYDLKRAATERAGSAKGACTEDGVVGALERVVLQLAQAPN